MKDKLKIDLHVHTSEDPYENISYNAFELIDRAHEQEYDVLSITNHNTVTYNKEIVRYAEKKDILLIPGMEGSFSRKHVLVINSDFQEITPETTLKDLEKYKNNTSLIIAAHPFFPGSATLKSLLHDYISLFDAIEFCHCYNHIINLNNKAIQTASVYNKPLVGTSDAHYQWQFGKTYSLVEADKDPFSVINAVKEGKIEIITSPLPLTTLLRLAVNFVISHKLKIPSHF